MLVHRSQASCHSLPDLIYEEVCLGLPGRGQDCAKCKMYTLWVVYKLRRCVPVIFKHNHDFLPSQRYPRYHLSAVFMDDSLAANARTTWTNRSHLVW
jgi:hypothetical protein